MKKPVVFAVLFVAFLSFGILVAGAPDVHAKETVLRLVIPVPITDYPLATQAVDMTKRFNKRAKGQYQIEVHAGGSLAKIPEYFDAVRVGAVEMACVDWAIFSFLDPRFNAVSTPFLVDSLEASNYMVKKLLPLHDAIFQEKFNAKALGMYSTDGLSLVSTTKPIKTLADWKGLLVGAGSPVTSTLFKTLGASPVTIMWTDLYESLQKHIIDAAAQTTHGAIAMNLMGVCDYITPFFGHANFNGYTINLDAWKKMPPNIQKILQEEIDRACKQAEGAFLKLPAEDAKILKQKGKKIYVLPKAERAKWAALMAPYKEKQLASYGEFGAKVKEIAEEANKKYPYEEMVIK
jgi:TRAP-type C4-dicarboxylate transport system substrate-binding protein